MKKSKYAQKQSRKRGNGVIDPAWMSWHESPEKPRRMGRHKR